MKQIAKLMIAILLPLLCMSCSDFLTVENKTSTNAQGYVDSYDAAFNTLAVCYAKLGTNKDGLMGYERFMMPTDLTEMYGVFQSFTWDKNNGNIKDLWRKYYKFITDANFAIKTMEEYSSTIDATFNASKIESGSFIANCESRSDFSPSKMLLGEAKVLRAYAYFTLYRYFGGVPIIDKLQEGGAVYIPRASREELFDFIESDLRYAIRHCADNSDGTLYGRITKNSAAGLLAKCLVFEGSYIRRAEKYADQIGEEIGNTDRASLYRQAINLCDTLINKKIGNNDLVPFYPAVFTTRNNEMLICFDGHNSANQGSSYASNWGIGGNSSFGATGSNSTSLHPMIYDFKMWEHQGSARELFKYYGAMDGLAEGPGVNVNEAFRERGEFTFTGDSTRRMWNVAKLFITGPTHRNLPAGLWCFEPYGETLGEEFYIAPCKGEANYSDVEKNIIQQAITGGGWVDTRWYNASDKFSTDLLRVGCFWRFAKFRRALPQTIDHSTYTPNDLDIQIPILRMGEIYLLKAEAQYHLGQTDQAIATLNQIRDRASNQSTLKDMYLNWGEAKYTHKKGAVVQIPSNIEGDVLLLEILWERARELCGEDTCRWFDIARYPDMLADVYYTMENYRDPLHHMGWYWQKYIGDIFSKDKVSRALMPIPATEFQYFPDLVQNPGY